MPVKNHPSFQVQENSITLSDAVIDEMKEFALKKFTNCAFTKGRIGRNEPVVLPEKSLKVADRNIISEIFKNQDQSPQHKWAKKLFSYLEGKKCCQKIFDKLTKDPVEICVETALNFEAWLAERKFRITGSAL